MVRNAGGVVLKKTSAKQVFLGPPKIDNLNDLHEEWSSAYSELFISIKSILEVNLVLNRQSKDYKKGLTTKMQKLVKRLSLSSSDKEEMMRIILALLNAVDSKNPDIDIRITNRKVLRLIENFALQYRLPETMDLFVKKMSLVYLITLFETFIERELRALFKYNPQILTNPDKTLSYEQIIKSVDKSELLDLVIDKELDSLINRNRGDLSKFFKKHLGLEMDKRIDFFEFDELFYRRNIIIHNNSIGTPEYIRKFIRPYKSNVSDKDFIILNVNYRYLKHAVKLIRTYAKVIEKSLRNKYKLRAMRRTLASVKIT
jgi:hypothetical protein